LNYQIAALALSAAFTSCGGGSSGSGGKGLSGTYVGYVDRTKTTFTFSGNRFKIDGDGFLRENEGVFELVEEYKDDDFSRGTLIFTHRTGKEEIRYSLEGKILTMNDSYVFIKGGKSGKIPNGTYSYNSRSCTFSGNNVIENYNGSRINESTYEFIVGYEDKSVSKGYILLKEKNGEVTGAISCVLEKDKLTIGGRVYTKE